MRWFPYCEVLLPAGKPVLPAMFSAILPMCSNLIALKIGWRPTQAHGVQVQSPQLGSGRFRPSFVRRCDASVVRRLNPSRLVRTACAREECNTQ